MFTFEDGVKFKSYVRSGAEISAYSTDIYRSSVRGPNAQATDRPDWWPGKGRYKQYLADPPADGDGIIVRARQHHGSIVRDIDILDGPPWYRSNFDGSVSFLPIPDDSKEPVTIDNLDPASTPAPGAVLLGMFGLSVIGVKLRKYA